MLLKYFPIWCIFNQVAREKNLCGLTEYVQSGYFCESRYGIQLQPENACRPKTLMLSMKGKPQCHGLNWCQTRLYIIYIARGISGVWAKGNSIYCFEKCRNEIPGTSPCMYLLYSLLFLLCFVSVLFFSIKFLVTPNDIRTITLADLLL